MRQTNVLVVEDEPLTREMTVQFLANEGFAVRAASDLSACRAALNAQPADIVILDLGLPGEDGLVLAQELRADPSVEVIVVTMRSEPDDRIIALDSGADDYLIKPVHLGELAARVRAAERRQHRTRRKCFSFGGFTLDPDRRVLIDRQGSAAPLTRGEFGVLLCLAEADGKIVSRETLSQVASRRSEDTRDLRSVDALISRLRRKLGDREAITTAPGFGYRLALKSSDR